MVYSLAPVRFGLESYWQESQKEGTDHIGILAHSSSFSRPTNPEHIRLLYEWLDAAKLGSLGNNPENSKKVKMIDPPSNLPNESERARRKREKC